METIFYLFAYIFTSKVYNSLISVLSSILYFLPSSIFILFILPLTISTGSPFILPSLILISYLALESSKYFNSNSQLSSLYKDSKDKYATLNFYNNPFVVCATGRTSKEITLNNGIKAFIGYYDESIWSDISFYELNPNIAFINNNLLDDQNEFLEMVKTLNIENYKL